MKTEHIQTKINKDNHNIVVWLHPVIDIEEFEKKIHAAPNLLEACKLVMKQKRGVHLPAYVVTALGNAIDQVLNNYG